MHAKFACSNDASLVRNCSYHPWSKWQNSVSCVVLRQHVISETEVSFLWASTLSASSSASASLCIPKLCNLDYISQFGQIQFASWTNTICNFYKYILWSVVSSMSASGCFPVQCSVCHSESCIIDILQSCTGQTEKYIQLQPSFSCIS